MTRNVLCNVLENVKQSTARFEALDILTVHVHSAMIPLGFGNRTETAKGRPLSSQEEYCGGGGQ
jgi:hypothetical protein